MEKEKGMLNVGFKDNSDIVMSKKLFDLIATKEKGTGNVTDRVQFVLSTKYLQDMAEYGLEMNMVNFVSRGMETLAHNLREALIAKTFNCSGADRIAIDKLLSDHEEDD